MCRLTRFRIYGLAVLLLFMPCFSVIAQGNVKEITHPRLPGQKFQQVFDASGNLVSGTQFYKSMLGNSTPRFTGTFLQSRPHEGVYDNGVGIQFKGSFEFVAFAGGKGVYIFYGDVSDPDEDTIQTGLYVSDLSEPGFGIIFYPADQGYLTSLLRKQRRMQ